MGTGKILLTAILAGIYSSILNNYEEDFGLNRIVSILSLMILTFITGYLLFRIGKKNKEN